MHEWLRNTLSAQYLHTVIHFLVNTITVNPKLIPGTFSNAVFNPFSIVQYDVMKRPTEKTHEVKYHDVQEITTWLILCRIPCAAKTALIQQGKGLQNT